MKIFVIIIFLIPITGYSQMKNGSWIAPGSSKEIEASYKFDDAFVKKGKVLFNNLCVVCHGNKGKGDGIAGISLKPRPTNFTLPKVQLQTDGELYWKMTNGRPPMAGYKAIISDEQRWQLVSYIRRLKK